MKFRSIYAASYIRDDGQIVDEVKVAAGSFEEALKAVYAYAKFEGSKKIDVQSIICEEELYN